MPQIHLARSPSSQVTPAEVEVARCDLRVKTIEVKIAQLKEDELRVKLRDAWKREGEEMQDQLGTLKHTVQTVKLYPALVCPSSFGPPPRVPSPHPLHCPHATIRRQYCISLPPPKADHPWAAPPLSVAHACATRTLHFSTPAHTKHAG